MFHKYLFQILCKLLSYLSYLSVNSLILDYKSFCDERDNIVSKPDNGDMITHLAQNRVLLSCPGGKITRLYYTSYTHTVAYLPAD